MYDQAVTEAHVEADAAGPTAAAEADDGRTAPGADLLVEEVSIDGMCGVY